MRNRFLLCAAAAFVLAGCSGEAPQTYGSAAPDGKSNSAEDLLTAEGKLELVEDKREPSPVQQHMNARKQVNPSKIDGPRSYTSKVSAKDLDEDVHFRVLRMEGDKGKSDRDEAGDKFANADQDMAATRWAMPGRKPTAQKGLNLNKSEPVKERRAIAQAQAQAVAEIIPASGGMAEVVDVRIGEHPGKTRLVLDLDSPADYTIEIDNNKNTLEMEIPQAGWSALAEESFTNHPLIDGYTVRKSGQGGAVFVLALKKPAKLLMSSAFPPNEVHGQRIVLDLGAL